MADDLILIDEMSIKDRIYTIRGVKVMLDFDLAEIYGYSTKAFNQQVYRNSDKFDDDFRFQLTKEETDILVRSQLVTSRADNLFKGQSGGRRYLPYAFTEQGIYMLMTVLRGELAIMQSKALIRTFRAMKDYFVENLPEVSSREMMRLSLKNAENAEKINEIRIELSEQRRILIEHDDRLVKAFDEISGTVRRSEISPFMLDFSRPEERKEYLFLDGQPMRSDLAYMEIYGRSTKSIHIIDDYISLKTLHLLCGVDSKISITIISDNLRGLLHLSDYQDCQRENPDFKVDFIRSMGASHDRFIMLDHRTDNERLFLSGPSSKDSGNRMSSILEFRSNEIVSLFSDKLSELLKNPPLQLY